VTPPRHILVLDSSLPADRLDLCRAFATELATELDGPVTVATVSSGIVDRVRAVVSADLASESVDVTAPPRVDRSPMGSAPFVWREDGRPDWGAMWTTFCELALYGGPPHRGEDNPLRSPHETSASDSAIDPDIVAEMRRGIWETTGLFAEPADRGWIAVTCLSSRMAAWLCATIILENVDARCEEERLLLPLAADFRLEDQVKSVITVLAKTHHYWQAHVTGPSPGD
jgi:hypothetical protein